MNYFAHAIPFLDNPYLVAGTAVPDWLSVADRKCRARRKHAEPLVEDSDPVVGAIARGVIQHIQDDAHFHQSRTFVELSLELSGQLKKVVEDTSGYRTAFLGHLLVEVLLDADLIASDTTRLQEYYRLLARTESRLIERTVNRMARQSTDRLAPFIDRFCEARILWDYLEDGKLLVRLNQVMRRLRFDPLPESFRPHLGDFRKRVARRRTELLDGLPSSTTNNTTGTKTSPLNHEGE